MVPVSIIDEGTLEAFKAAVWALTGLIRVYLRKNGSVDPEPAALHPGATVADVADGVHHDLGATFTGARVWGASARFTPAGRQDHLVDGERGRPGPRGRGRRRRARQVRWARGRDPAIRSIAWPG